MKLLIANIVLILLVVACGNVGATRPPTPPSEPPATPTPVPTTRKDNAGAPTTTATTVRFTTLGSATLTAIADKTRVSMSTTGFGPSTSHGVMIRVGTCAQSEAQDFSDVIFDLPTLQGDDKGVATTVATLDIPLLSLMDGNHKITVGMFPGRSRGADCGDISKATAGNGSTP